jgi:hypothetical protein
MKRIYLFLIINILLLFISASPVLAQCPDIPEKSSCISCHQTSSIPPERASYDWHNTHFQKDCCTRCHGGNCIAEDEEIAHEGLIVQPLEDIYTSCRGCHPDDYVVLANQLAASIGVIPGSLPTPTPVPTSPSAGSALFLATPVVPVQSGVPISVPLVLGGSLIVWFGIIALLARRLQTNNTSPSRE